jgi:hypothetical protein
MAFANVILDAILYTQGRKRYQFYAGRTDSNGHLCLTFDALENERRVNQTFSIMDYNTPVSECDARIDLFAPSAEQLQEQYSRIQQWFPDKADSLVRVEGNANGAITCEPVRADLMEEVGGCRRTVHMTCSVR